MPAHILIVDDEAIIREVLAQAFTAAGFRVSIASSANDALQIVMSDPPNVVMTDLQLDDSDGFELAGQIKERVPGMPIILLTGVLFDPETLRESAGDKISTYVPKTAPLSRIVDEVKRLIAS